MVVDVYDILALQLVAIVVNLILNVERTVDIERFLASAHEVVHLRQRVFCELHHLVQVLILALVEVVLLALYLAINRAGNIVTGVTNTLQLTNLAQHGTDFTLCVVRQMGVAHLIEIFGNLYLHIVGDALILLDTRIELDKFLLVLLDEQLTHHTEHALHALRERLNLLLCLQHRELRRLHEAGSNKVQAEVFFLVHLLRLDNPAYEALNLRDEPNQDERVDHIKAGMEGCQYERQFGGIGEIGFCSGGLLRHHGVVTYHAADQVDEGPEDK